MKDHAAQIQIISDYITAQFPSATIERIMRAGDPNVPNVKPHEFGAELFAIRVDGRRYDVALSDEFLSDVPNLEIAIEGLAVAKLICALPKRHRLWVGTIGTVVTRLDENPSW